MQVRKGSQFTFYPGSKTMIQDIVKTVVLSAVARITENISTLYIGIGATLIVLVCSYFIYKHFFNQPVATPKQVEVAPQVEEVPTQQQRPTPEQIAQREEAFAAAMQAEQEAMEQELQKRHAEQASSQQASSQQASSQHASEQSSKFDEEFVQP